MRRIRISLIEVFVVACLAAPVAAESRIPLGFRVLGGGVYLPAGDLNATRGGFDMNGHMSRLRLGADLGAEIVWSFSPSFGLTLGSGYIFASKLSSIESSDFIESLDTRARAIPLTIGATYVLASLGAVDFSIHGDIGYYFAHWDETWAWTFPVSGQIQENHEIQKANAGGIGFQGRLAVTYRFSRAFALVGELFGRWADIKGFEGSTVSEYYTGYRSEKDGKLYYYDWEDDGQYYPWIEIMDKMPHEQWSSGVKNDRAAVISFSGFGLRIGFSIRI